MKTLNLLKWLCGIMGAMYLTNSCGLKTETSNLDYGILVGYDNWGQSFTIDIPPGDQSVLICGTNEYAMLDLAREAFYNWADKIGRSDVKVEIQEMDPYYCSRGSSFWMITTVVDDNCSEGVLGWNQSDFHGNTIAICDGTQATLGQMLEDTMLHEVGHSWGMCDQYYYGSEGFDPQRHHDNCDEILRSETATDSIMNAGGAPKASVNEGVLTKDDITGIRVAACLNREANRAWLEYNPSLITSWKQDPYFVEQIGAIYEKDANALLPECIGSEGDSAITDEANMVDCSSFSLEKSQFWFVTNFYISGPLEEVDYAVCIFGNDRYKVTSDNFGIYSFETEVSVDLHLKSGQVCAEIL